MSAPSFVPAFECLWQVKDVAAYFGLSRSWVYQRAESGELPSLKVGGALRFEPEVVRAWARGERPAGVVIPLRR